MSQTLLIGYVKKSGTFTNKETGEVVAYNNRILCAITDDGENDVFVGFQPFEEKIKTSELAKLLRVPDDDKAVDDVLNSLINKPVEFRYAPRNGNLALVGFSAKK